MRTEYWTILREDNDGRLILANDPNADAPDYYPYAQLRYDDYEDPNIINGDVVDGANSTFRFEIDDLLRSWGFKMFLSRDNITFTEDKTYGIRTFPEAEGITASDFSNLTFPLSNTVTWDEKPISDFPNLADYSDNGIAIRLNNIWSQVDRSQFPYVNNFSNGQVPVRRSGAWTGEIFFLKYRAYLLYDGSTTVIYNPATSESGLTKHVINTLGLNPSSIVRNEQGDYTLTFGSAYTLSKFYVDFPTQPIYDSGGVFAGYVNFNAVASTITQVNIQILDTTGTKVDVQYGFVPIFFDLVS